MARPNSKIDFARVLVRWIVSPVDPETWRAAPRPPLAFEAVQIARVPGPKQPLMVLPLEFARSCRIASSLRRREIHLGKIPACEENCV